MVMMKKIFMPICLLSVCFVMSSWGFLGHKTIQQLAIYELPKSIRPFFYKNKDKLVYDALRADIRRRTDSTEATKHFIDLEMFGKNAVNEMPMDWDAAVKKYTKDSLLKYGYVPYHVIYMKGKLTEAFRENNKDSILFYAADIGHYISDAHVPLHTTVNYDGQFTNQIGVHSLWESMIPEIEIANYTLNSSHKATYLKHPEHAIWSAIRVSAALVPEMLMKEKEVSSSFTEEQKYRIQIRRGKPSKSYTSEFAKAYAVALKSSINDRLIASANLVADFYYTAWVDAGKPNLQHINKDFSEDDEKSLKVELKLYQQNRLIANDKLIAKKTVAGSKEEF